MTARRKPDSEVTQVQRWRRKNPGKVYRQRHDKCECGALKTGNAASCWNCYYKRASRPPGHRAEYMRNYMREHKPSSECECGRKKARSSDICIECWRSIPKRTKGALVLKGRTLAGERQKLDVQEASRPHRCPLCRVDLRLKEWHGRTYLQCPGCGLERKIHGYLYEGDEERAA